MVVLLGREPGNLRTSQPHLVEPERRFLRNEFSIRFYLGIVVIVETDVCESPEEEDHDRERGGLIDRAEHSAQVVVEDESDQELQK